jgi:hypothetical protein
MAKRIKTSGSSVVGGLQRKSEVTEFNPDYTFVKRDLKRIVVLAGSIFVVMIALTFFIK